MTSNRRGQAQSALRAVQGRHEAIQKIERQMIELAQLFQDMEAAVVQQEPAVENIDTKAEDTVQNLGKGNQQLDQAVDKARAARRKKWICLGIFSALLSATFWKPFRLTKYSSHHRYCCRRHCRCGCCHKKEVAELGPLLIFPYIYTHHMAYPHLSFVSQRPTMLASPTAFLFSQIIPFLFSGKGKDNLGSERCVCVRLKAQNSIGRSLGSLYLPKLFNGT